MGLSSTSNHRSPERKDGIMKQRFKSFRYRILLPVVILLLVIITLLNTLHSRSFINMIRQQEQEVNAVGFDTVSSSLIPLVNTSITEVRRIMSDERVTSYARLQYTSAAELIHARIRCRDYLQTEISSRDGMYGLLFMRKDGSLFGALPEGNIFQDRPEENPLPEDMKSKILNAPLGQTVWVGPVSGAALYGFQNSDTPQSIMIAAWKSVHVSYGECYALMLMDETIFVRLFSSLRDGKSAWYLFSEDLTEICHTGQNACPDPERLIRESNSGSIFRDENDLPATAFSMKMEDPAWTLVRKVSMENYEKMSSDVMRTIAILGGLVALIALALYDLWLKKFTRQFNTLMEEISDMGQDHTAPAAANTFSVTEFEPMHQVIDRTSHALNDQMDTIRRMTAEQERISTEMNLAREIQASALPLIFPPFPEREDIDLYATMTPAKEVGGDFYDFFMIDDDHLALVIADVSGKGIPAALFMMVSKALIKNQLMTGLTPAEAVANANQQLCENNESSMFVTVWTAVIELSTGMGMACNAGHEHPAIRRAGGQFALQKSRHNMFVGVSKKAKYQNREFEMRPGDCLFVYTDGVPEAQNAREELFGEERLIEALNQEPNPGPEELLPMVRQAVDDFVKDAPQFDDLTMLCFRYLGVRSRE